MKKNKADQLINLTMEIVRHFWAGDADFLEPFLDEDACYIASYSSGLLTGKEGILSELHSVAQSMPECSISQQEFLVATQDRHLCVVVGHYLLTLSQKNHELKKSRRRATFIWKDHADGRAGISHLHFSEPLREADVREITKLPDMKDENRFSNKLNSAFDGTGETITVKGTDGKIRIIPIGEIEYAEARDHNTCLYFANREGMPQRDGTSLCVRIDWKFVKDLLSGCFLTVSRSFAVNYRYVKSFNHHEIEMDSGARISIPRNRYADVQGYLESKYAD